MIDKLTGRGKIIRSSEANNPDFRNREIEKAVEENKIKDTLIMQKVNFAHREAFKEKFPGQIEHCMRLTAERLQSLLTSKPEDMRNTMTWDGSPDEIKSLCDALYHLSIMNQHYPVEEKE